MTLQFELQNRTKENRHLKPNNQCNNKKKHLNINICHCGALVETADAVFLEAGRFSAAEDRKQLVFLNLRK